MNARPFIIFKRCAPVSETPELYRTFSDLLFKNGFNECLDKVPGSGHQADESTEVSPEPRCQQDDATDQDQGAVQKFFGWHPSFRQFPLNPLEKFHPLAFGQVCSRDSSQQNHRNRWPHANKTPRLDESINFQNWDKNKDQ